MAGHVLQSRLVVLDDMDSSQDRLHAEPGLVPRAAGATATEPSSALSKHFSAAIAYDST